MIEHLQLVIDWVGENPSWTLLAVFLCCIGESILGLGALIPTTVVLLGAGAFVAHGAFSFWTATAVSVAGAIVGDSINFWVGWRWGNVALESPWLAQYREAIDKSREAFERHRAKALVLARFIGLIRPFVAAIAGAYRMPIARYLAVELFAAFIWAAPIVAVGVVFGASLALASEVATRLAILLVTVLAVLGVLVWLVTVMVAWLGRHADTWMQGLLAWSQRHRRLGRLGSWLAEPDQPETPALAVLAAALFGLGWLWLTVWWWNDRPGLFDTLAWQGALDLHTPLATALALGISKLSDVEVYGPVAFTVLVTLLLLGRNRAAAHYAAAVAFGTALAAGLYWLLEVPDPINYYAGEARVRFGGRDLVLATVIYAFLPVLLATHRPPAWRVVYYAMASVLIALMLAADFYLGTVWFSTGLFAVLFGGAWVTLLGIGYRRHGGHALPAREVLPLALGVMIAAAALQGSVQLRNEDLHPVEARNLGVQRWWAHDWQELPSYRVDASGIEKQPLTVQWRSDLPRIDRALREQGWDAPPAVSWGNSLRWLALSAPLAELPVLPQVHAGAHQALMLRQVRGDNEQWVIRLWPSGWTAGGLPLYVGTLARQTGSSALRFIHYPRGDKDYDAPLVAFEPPPPGFEARRVVQQRRDAEDGHWSGELWLLRPRREP